MLALRRFAETSGKYKDPKPNTTSQSTKDAQLVSITEIASASERRLLASLYAGSSSSGNRRPSIRWRRRSNSGNKPHAGGRFFAG